MSETYKEKKPEEYNEEYIEFSPDILPKESDNHEMDFLYGKSIEKLGRKQVSGVGAQLYKGNATYNSTGVKTVSGVGFTPTLIKITASNSYSISDGVYFNGGVQCRYLYVNSGSSQSGVIGYSSYVWNAGNATITTTITPTSDGFTINVVNVGAGAIDIMYECYA